MSGVDSVEAAVQVLRLGADEFLPKALSEADPLGACERIATKIRVDRDARRFMGMAPETRRFTPIELLSELPARFASAHNSPARAFRLDAMQRRLASSGTDDAFEKVEETGVKAARGAVVALENVTLAAGGPAKDPPAGERTQTIEATVLAVTDRLAHLSLDRLAAVATSGVPGAQLSALIAKHGGAARWASPAEAAPAHDFLAAP